jgi:uncharacterized protein YecT (DUF1311 family)
MNSKMTIMALPILFPWLSASAGQLDCSNPSTTVDMKVCIGRDIRRADAELNAHYKELIKLLEQWAERGVVGGQYQGSEYVRRTREAQRAWIKYRDAECGREALAMLSGTGESVIEMSCHAFMTQKRANQLKEDLERFHKH